MSRGVGSLFHPKAIAGLFGVRFIMRMVGLQIGSPQIQRDVENIVAGLVSKHVGLGGEFLAPAGVTNLIVDVADGFISGQGISLGGMSIGGGSGSGLVFAGE